MGIITFSLDTETVWGRINDPNCKQYMSEYTKTSKVLHRLIDLFDKYEIPATWAFVGLGISPDNIFQEFINDRFQDVYSENEQAYFKKNLGFLGDYLDEFSLIPHLEQLKNSKIKHDIGSHTFSHLYMGWHDSTERKSKFYNDLLLFDSVANHHDLDVGSFIYPRNFICEQNILNEFGYKIYRTKNRDFTNLWLRRFNEIIPLKSFTVREEIHLSEITSIPGSMIYRVRSSGIRKHVPVAWMHKKALKGISKVVLDKDIFHVWLHPFNFAYKTEEHFFYFERLLKQIKDRIEQGELEVKTMKEFVS